MKKIYLILILALLLGPAMSKGDYEETPYDGKFDKMTIKTKPTYYFKERLPIGQLPWNYIQVFASNDWVFVGASIVTTSDYYQVTGFGLSTPKLSDGIKELCYDLYRERLFCEGRTKYAQINITKVDRVSFRSLQQITVSWQYGVPKGECALGENVTVISIE